MFWHVPVSVLEKGYYTNFDLILIKTKTTDINIVFKFLLGVAGINLMSFTA